MLVAALLSSARATNSVVTCSPSNPADCMCDGAPIGPATWTPPSWLVSNKTSIFETSVMMEGKETPLANYQAKATMVVNVASA